MINLLLPTKAATIQTLGHPAAGVIGWFDASDNASGVAVTTKTALNFAAVWCGVRIIAETVGILPCILYRRTSDDGRERATDDPRYDLVHNEPHPEMSAGTYFEVQTAHMVMSGNAYARIRSSKTREQMTLEIRAPETVQTKVIGDAILYEVQGDAAERIPSTRMLHARGLGGDGVSGWSVVQFAQQSMGTGLAGEKFAASMLGSGATPNGIIEHPGRLDKEARAELRRQWNEIHQGSNKAGNVGIMHGGMKFQPISMSAEDAQFLQSREYSVREIARWFRLPPHMLADLRDSSVRANIEQQAIEFIVYSMTPWLRRWEHELNRKLLEKDERSKLYFEFLVDSLLRGDIKSRYEAYAIGRQWGWLSENDVRVRENMNRIDGGDDYLRPLNMEIVGQPRAEIPEQLTADMQSNFAKSLEEILDSGREMYTRLSNGQEHLQIALVDADRRAASRMQSLHVDRDEIRKEIAALGGVQVRGYDADRQNLIEGCNALIQDHLRCLIKVERSKVKRASNEVSRGRNFCQWLDEFYAGFSEQMSVRIKPATDAYASLSRGQVNGLHEFIADMICTDHKMGLLAASDGDRSQFAERIQDEMDKWDEEIDAIKCEDIER